LARHISAKRLVDVRYAAKDWARRPAIAVKNLLLGAVLGFVLAVVLAAVLLSGPSINLAQYETPYSRLFD
jgi:flagellar biosynthesis protein FliR